MEKSGEKHVRLATDSLPKKTIRITKSYHKLPVDKKVVDSWNSLMEKIERQASSGEIVEITEKFD